jgi:hypothetical protein
MLVVAMVLVIAGIVKVKSHTKLERLLAGAGFRIPKPFAKLIWAIPVFECLGGLWLLSGVYPVMASFYAAALFLSFEIVLSRAQRRGFAGSCGCFGSSGSRPIGLSNHLLNGMLFACCLFMGVRNISHPEGVIAWTLSSAEVVLGAVLGGFVLLISSLARESDWIVRLLWQRK